MKTIFLIVVVMLATFSSGAQVHAKPQATYELVRSSIGPGGNGSTGPYTLSSSIGQPAAGEVSAGSYTLGGGFWGGGIIVPAIGNYSIYVPLIQR